MTRPVHTHARPDSPASEASAVALAARFAAGDFSEDVLRWLQTAVRRSIESSDYVPLDRWLGLPSGSHAQRRRRDAWLARAYQLTAGSSGRARAKSLAREIDAFTRTAQYVSSEGVLAGVRLNDLRMAIFRAWSQRVPMPSSWRHLLRICDKNSVEMSRPPAVQSNMRPSVGEKETVE